jgi:hypothetical protein
MMNFGANETRIPRIPPLNSTLQYIYPLVISHISGKKSQPLFDDVPTYMGGTPIYRWMIYFMEKPSINGRFRGTPF